MKTTTSISVALVALLAAASASAGTTKDILTKEMTRKMEEGWVTEYREKGSDKGTGVYQWTALGIFDDTPEAMLYVLLGFDKYKHFVQHMKGSRIIKRKGLDTYAVLETRLPWPVKDAWVYFKAKRKHLPGRIYELEFQMINGTMKHFSGWARVEPWNKDGSRGLLTWS